MLGHLPFLLILTGVYRSNFSVLLFIMVTAIGLSYILGKKMADMFLGVSAAFISILTLLTQFFRQ